MTTTERSTLSTVVEFIGQQLELHRAKYARSGLNTTSRIETVEEGLDALPDRREQARNAERTRREVPPLFIGVQGPQGCGELSPLSDV
jgi:hypothetical protein